MSPHITRLNPDDWDRFRAIRLAALAADPDAFGSTFAGEAPQPESFWRERLGRATTLVATLEGRDVGLATVARAWTEPTDGGLYSVWVDPVARGHGVGASIVEAAIRAARDAGFERLVLEVGDENTAAIALYARLGFEPTGHTTTLDPPRQHITEHQRALAL